MMTTKEIHTVYRKIVGLLDRKELKAAFDALQNLVAGLQASGLQIPGLQDEQNRLQETYKQLLHYYIAGSKDPMQTKIYNELLASVYELTDKITQKLLAGDSPALYYAEQRTHDVSAENMIRLTDTARTAYDLQHFPAAEASVSKLFKKIWTTTFLSEEEMKSLRDTLVSKHANAADEPENVSILNCQIVSALTLGLQAFFDKRKMHLLIDAAESRDEEVSIRAYTGILLTLYTYQCRMDYYPELGHRLDHLAETPGFGKTIYLIILRFILSRDTEKISNKLKDEIIPEMMKLNPKFNPRISLRDITPESLEGEMNPEWMEKFSDSPLGKKIEEFNKLQEEGADVMHSTFVHLKNFSFFSELNNWFMPFHEKQSALSGDDTLMKSLELMTHAGLMCDSDLYSLYFSFKQIPEEGRKMMMAQLESQLSELKQQKRAELQTKSNHTERIIGKYVQDLYRFYKLYQRRHEFNDIFTQKLDFHNLAILQRYFSDKEDLQNIAEYYLRKNYFEDALTIYRHLAETSESDEMLFQKMGYCKQMTGDYPGALEAYAKAEIIDPESKWLLRRTAQCYRAVKEPEKAIGYYLHYEKSDPENLSVLLSIGSCYLEMKNYSEALKYYFKVDYLDHNSNKAWRPIAWCSFLTGKYDQARNYYHKIISHQPDSQDFMNAGHTEWVLQNTNGALEFYQKSVQTAHFDFEKFKTDFQQDIPDLTAAGINAEEFPLMLDQLQYLVTPSI